MPEPCRVRNSINHSIYKWVCKLSYSNQLTMQQGNPVSPFRLQVKSILRKNFVSALRSKEIHIEVSIALVISVMLVFKAQLGAISTILPMIFGLTQCATARAVAINITEEKSKRFKETQKIMGLSQSAYITGWVLTAYGRAMAVGIIFCTSWGLLTAMTEFDWYDQYTSGFFAVSGTFLIYSIAMMNQALLVSAVSSEVKLTGEIMSFFQVLLNFLTYAIFVPAVAESSIFYYFIGILSPSSSLAFVFAGIMSTSGSAITHLFPSKLISQVFSLGDATILLTSMMFVYFVAFIYADQVMPNEFGVQKHPLFFLKYLKFKRRGGEKFEPAQDLLVSLMPEKKKFRDYSSAIYHETLKNAKLIQPTICIIGLTKEFGSFKAVDNLTLYLYESQIFCLLGHNGAGKTTTISLLTGLYEKTAGQVTMYGMDLDKELIEIRKNVGLCTQRDTLYPYLTVMEHLTFMAGIKGIVSTRFDHILAITELGNDCDKLVNQLSGGSMRKLSLALSLLGDAKIIFLDEPTSGMDAYSRRSIWKILERIKLEKRTIILTTHHLDEAEILADRIGIMARGQLLAVGSSDFIKRKFGEGYNLKIRLPEDSESFVKESITQGQIVLINPQTQFTSNTQDDSSDSGSSSQTTSKLKRRGSNSASIADCMKSPGRIYVLNMLRKYIPEGSLSEQQSAEALHYLVPFQSQRQLSQLFKNLEAIPKIQVSMEMNTLEDAFVNIGMEEERFLIEKEEERLRQKAKNDLKDNPKPDMELNEEFQSKSEKKEDSTPMIVPDCLRQAPKHRLSLQLKAIFYRRLLVSLRTTTNFFALLFVVFSLVAGIVVIQNMPFQNILHSESAIEFLQLTILGSLGVMCFSFSSSIIISLPVLEKELKLKQCLMSVGCSKVAYWMGTFLFDYLFYLVEIGIYFGVSAVVDCKPIMKNLSQAILMYVVFGINLMAYTYAASTLFNNNEQALKVFSVMNFFAVYCIPYTIEGVLNYIYMNSPGDFIQTIIYITQLISLVLSPFWTFFQGFALIQNNYAVVRLNAQFAGPLLVTNYKIYCFVLLMQAFFFACVLVYFEQRKEKKPQSVTTSRLLSHSNYLDKEVKAEHERVINMGCEDRIKCIMLEKEYTKGENVLQQVTFGVKSGEIFGIIGPNCAGKSTIINSLIGLITPTGGKALIDQQPVPLENWQQQIHLGVCPQFDCLWETLTPGEHLNLFGRIKGLSGTDLAQAQGYFIHTMQLDYYVNTKAGNLSGGNKRKLCVADALIGGTSITFFDEPSTGVDPIARRFLFQTLKNNVSLRDSAVMMTTHTIEEAELLCDRLGILVKGQFVCLGSPEQLRKEYSSGYTISVKLLNQTQMDAFINSIQHQFANAKILDDKRNLQVTFALQDENFSFFRTFEYFDMLIGRQVIEDFSINQSSLESIFLYFSKQQSSTIKEQQVVQ